MARYRRYERIVIAGHLDPAFLDLVARKLTVTTDPVDTSAKKGELLVAQIEAQLKPVLRAKDFEEFVLERAFAALEEVVSRCQRR
jgi:hypothetical protein